MQSGLDRTERIPGNLLNFLEFITLGVVQKHDQAVLVAQSGKRLFEPHYVIQPFCVA